MFKLAMVGILLLFSMVSQANSITEKEKQDIVNMVNEIKIASENRDIEGIMKYLSKDVVIKNDGSVNIPQLNYQSYKRYITEAFPLLSDYQYISSVESVERAKNGSDIFVKMLLNEKYVFQKKQLDESHYETWWIRKTNNHYKVYQVYIENT